MNEHWYTNTDTQTNTDYGLHRRTCIVKLESHKAMPIDTTYPCKSLRRQSSSHALGGIHVHGLAFGLSRPTPPVRRKRQSPSFTWPSPFRTLTHSKREKSSCWHSEKQKKQVAISTKHYTLKFAIIELMQLQGTSIYLTSYNVYTLSPVVLYYKMSQN